MIDREKVIQKLEKSLKEMRANRICIEDVIELEEAAYDALALLKEQEPRVMTLGDVRRDHDRVVWIECREYKSLIIAQYRGQASWHNGRFGKWERFATMMFWDYMHSESDEYGKTWRCWTSRPSPEQMRETKWEEDSDADQT